MSAFAAHAAAINAACLAAFGTPVTYQPKAPLSAPVSIKAVLSSPAVLEDASPKSFDHAFVQLSDLAARPVIGDTITVGSDAFTVTDIGVDAEGGVSLTIQQAP